MNKLIAMFLAAVLALSACAPEGTTPGATPVTTVTALSSVPVTPSMCSPLSPPTHEEVVAAVVLRLQNPGYDGPPRQVTVESLKFSLITCGNNSADLKVSYTFTLEEGGYRSVSKDEPLTLNFCGVEWVLDADNDCATDY